MKANELMIGDWVLCDGKPLRVNCVASNSVGLEGVESDTICKENMIEPIPLTEEILKKNEISFNIGPGGKYQGCIEGINIKVEYNIINYVHELQNALRLCGINKEIIL